MTALNLTFFGGPCDGEVRAIKHGQHVVTAVEWDDPPTSVAFSDLPDLEALAYKYTDYYVARFLVFYDKNHSRYTPPKEYRYLVSDHVTNCRVRETANFLLKLTGLFGVNEEHPWPSVARLS